MGRRPFVFFQRKKSAQAVSKPKCEGPKEPTTTQLSSSSIRAREYEWFAAPHLTTPESTLALAVLQRAILDIITPGTPKTIRKSALDWIEGVRGREFEDDYALSFSRITESITTMSVQEFRRKIREFTKVAESSSQRADQFRFQRG